MDITYYSQTNCVTGSEVAANATTIHSGCNHTMIHNQYLQNLFPNVFSENQTYIEISECGGGDNWPPKWLVHFLITGGVLFSLCFLGCMALLGWCCSFNFRKRQSKAEKDNLINHEALSNGYETNT